MSKIEAGQVYRNIDNPRKFIRIEDKIAQLWNYEWAYDLDKIDGYVKWYNIYEERQPGKSEWEITTHYVLFNVKQYCAFASPRSGNVYYSRKAKKDSDIRVPPDIMASLYMDDSIPFVNMAGEKQDDFNI